MNPTSTAVNQLLGHQSLDPLAGGEESSADEVCQRLAEMFGVRPDEVALLRLENQFLRFLYPPPLDKVGAIPLSTSSSVAARTATLRKAELFNNFSAVKHASIFEAVPLHSKSPPQPLPPNSTPPARPAPIQKLMSAPLVCDHEVVGVVQICRKGTAAPEFTREDLEKLVQVARMVARIVKQTRGTRLADAVG